MTPFRIAVVGAGLSGLATAFRLRRLAPHSSLSLFEAGPLPGGHVGTVSQNDFRIELGPNGFLSNRTEMLDLCRDLGLADRLVQADPAAAERYIFLGDRLRPLPKSPGEFLRSELLSWKGKLRFLAERFIGRRGPADESIADFGRRHFGAEATDVLLDAVVTGIFAGDYERLSFPACFPTIAEMERTHGSLLKAQGVRARERRRSGAPKTEGIGGALTAPRGGMRVVIDELACRLTDVLVCDCPVTAVRRHETGWRLEFAARAPEVFDAVVLAVGSDRQASMLAEYPAVAEELAAIPTAPVAVVALGYLRSDLPTEPRGFGHIAPERLGRPVLGVIWSSAIFPDQAPPEAFQFRALLGGDRRRDAVDWDDDRLIRTTRDELAATLGIAAEPVFAFVKRWPRAIPQYRVGHLARLERIAALVGELPGLYLTGYSFAGVGVGDCARESLRTAERVSAYLETVGHREART